MRKMTLHFMLHLMFIFLITHCCMGKILAKPTEQFDILGWLAAPNGLVNSLINEAIGKDNNGTIQGDLVSDPALSNKTNNFLELIKSVTSLIEGMQRAEHQQRIPTLAEFGVPVEITNKAGEAFDQLSATGLLQTIGMLTQVIEAEGIEGMLKIFNSPTIRASIIGESLSLSPSSNQSGSKNVTQLSAHALKVIRLNEAVDRSSGIAAGSNKKINSEKLEKPGLLAVPNTSTNYPNATYFDIKRVLDRLEHDPALQKEFANELMKRDRANSTHSSNH